MPRIYLPSEVTGTVWNVEVSAGDPVSADQTLVILESMKMEIPLTAPRAGVVLELLVAEGESVAEGQTVEALE